MVKSTIRTLASKVTSRLRKPESKSCKIPKRGLSDEVPESQSLCEFVQYTTELIKCTLFPKAMKIKKAIDVKIRRVISPKGFN